MFANHRISFSSAASVDVPDCLLRIQLNMFHQEAQLVSDGEGKNLRNILLQLFDPGIVVRYVCLLHIRTSFTMPVDIRTSVENEQAINSLVPRRSAASHPCGGPCKSSLPSSCSRNAGLSCTSSCCNLRAVSARHPPRGQREWLEPKCLWKVPCESRSSGRLVVVENA